MIQASRQPESLRVQGMACSLPIKHLSNFIQYELDSLAGFLKIVRSYYANTKDSSFINDNCELPYAFLSYTDTDVQQSKQL